MVELKVEGVTCAYDSAEALRGVSLSLGPGLLLGIVGPNGSGKSTLLKTIDGILKPTAGSVLLDGRETTMMKPAELARNVAVSQQDVIANPNLTVIETVLMGRSPHLSPLQPEGRRDIEVAAESMRMMGCEHLARRKRGELSGGERRRAALARALAQEPRVLLLDEPTTNLDVNNQLELMESVTRLCRERMITVLAVFHDLNLVARYSDLILMLKEGKVFAAGTPEEVLTEGNIRRVFNVEAEVTRNKVSRVAIMIVSAARPVG